MKIHRPKLTNLPASITESKNSVEFQNQELSFYTYKNNPFIDPLHLKFLKFTSPNSNGNLIQLHDKNMKKVNVSKKFFQSKCYNDMFIYP